MRFCKEKNRINYLEHTPPCVSDQPHTTREEDLKKEPVSQAMAPRLQDLAPPARTDWKGGGRVRGEVRRRKEGRAGRQEGGVFS